MVDKTITDLKDLLMEEIKKLTKKNDLSPVELENADKALKLICKIEKMERGEYADDDEGYSSRNYWISSYDHPMRYYDNRNGNQSYARGRYSSRSYDNNYSGHSIKDRMVSQLESMYDEAKTEHERQIVDEWIKRIASDNM